jgi:hypothetical protein
VRRWRSSVDRRRARVRPRHGRSPASLAVPPG